MLHCYSYIHTMYILILYLYDVYCWQILQAWQKEIAEAVLVCSIHSSVYKISVSLSTVDMYTIWIYEKIALALLNTNCYFQNWCYTTAPTSNPKWRSIWKIGLVHTIKCFQPKPSWLLYKTQKLLIKQFQIWSILIKWELSRG